MDAQPELALVARALNEYGLEAILIGNMAAALYGAPVSTIDIDLFFRKTPRNMQKLKQVADALDATILRLYYHVSALFRLHRERDGLQINFKWQIDSGRAYDGVRERAAVFQVGGQKLLAANLTDIIRSKRAEAGQEKHPAISFMRPLEMKKQISKNQESTAGERSLALKKESDRALIELIRFRLSLPPEKRLNCLRRKIGLRATCL